MVEKATFTSRKLGGTTTHSMFLGAVPPKAAVPSCHKRHRTRPATGSLMTTDMKNYLIVPVAAQKIHQQSMRIQSNSMWMYIDIYLYNTFSRAHGSFFGAYVTRE